MTGVPAGLKEALADRYDLHRLIGSGGMASVYAATDLKHQRQVACKVLDPEIAREIGDRFLAEIRITANLQHPHLLPVFDSGQVDGWSYFVMPLIAGGTLREKLDREGALPPDEALRLAREIGEAVCAAHAAGIIHRDIKPENVLLSQGHALLADFGIARREVSDHGVALTGTGVVLGTPKYMSPEQVAGERVDELSDMYSLACVLHEMLAGAPPFRAERASALAAAHLTTPAPTLSSLGVDTPGAVDDLLQMALEKDPDARPSSMATFVEALEDTLRGSDAAAGIGTRGRAANVGTLVSKLCNRWRQVNAFEAALREAWQAHPKRPQLYVIHGEEGNGHASLLERLVQTRVTDFAESIGPAESGAVLRLSVPWPKGPDPSVLERHLRIALFRELDPGYMGGDLSSARLAEISATQGTRVVVVDHDIRSQSWNAATEALLQWYVGKFWDTLPDVARQPQFLVFLNVVFEEAGPEIPWTKRVPRRRRQQRIRSRMERTLSAARASCPLSVLDELQPVTVDDVKDWFARNRIYESEQVRRELVESIFADLKEKPMATVEAALAEIHAAFATERTAQQGLAR